ncbi:hypothetical protein SAMN05443572_102578 [Myxococcus fulvus]|uniref:Peptidase MA-like domain-containing protein n=1 Tax=Myxococcus fulvus TaxID=33 RepID=A0A511SWM5_MYXFU|nr:hypothetical protein [Myxococcus fulvus]AKF83323.1 hypothetical protein MFUL124B02_34155 [Myxococcus fulvus 124B02]GEN06310.1 hypothetical protein MFU01_13470 [Myxococcus fulvus]SET52594.1 hypothetical protein SAMN05443572_102578 [Myxococcus fulvus]
MRSLLVALLVTATPQTPAQKAKELSGRKSWEELYLAFSSGDATTVPSEQRAVVSGALVKGCQALLKDDAVMAYSLGERAAVFEESAPALRCLASAARKTEQRAAAEATLVKGVTLFPKDGGFPLELGKLLLEEQDSAGAQAALEKVPPRTREAAEAKKLLQQARQQTLQEDSARAEASRIEKQLGGSPARGSQTRPASAQAGDDSTVVALETRPGMSVRTPRVGYESSVDSLGMRVRANSRFIIKYYNNNRDFSQRADYEGRVTEVLNEAYHFTRDFLGRARESPVEVVLYSAAEFERTFGVTASAEAAGIYMANAIRINNAVELTRSTKATLVHEYVHATVADICGGGNSDAMSSLPYWFNEGVAEYMEWRYQERDEPYPVMTGHLQAAAKQGRAIPLEHIAQVPPMSHRDPQWAYTVSALAAREMFRQQGSHRMLTLIRAVCLEGMPFDEALRTHYGKTSQDLDADIIKSLRKR